MGIENKDMPTGVTESQDSEQTEKKPLGYIEGSSGALTPYYSEEEKQQLIEEIRENRD